MTHDPFDMPNLRLFLSDLGDLLSKAIPPDLNRSSKAKPMSMSWGTATHMKAQTLQAATPAPVDKMGAGWDNFAGSGRGAPAKIHKMEVIRDMFRKILANLISLSELPLTPKHTCKTLTPET